MDEDRLRHSLAVARKMIEIGKEYNLTDKELQDLFLLSRRYKYRIFISIFTNIK